MASRKAARKRKRSSVTGRRVAVNGSPEEADPDETAAFMAGVLASLVRMARRHRLDVLTYLLSMAQLEAEEHVRFRSRQKLS
jgi:hypothetical protein